MFFFLNFDTAPPTRTFTSINSKRAVMYTSVRSGKFVSVLVSAECSVKRPFDSEITITLNRYNPDAKIVR